MNRIHRLSSIWRGIVLVGDLLLGALAFYGAFWIRIYLPIPGTSGLMPDGKIGFLAETWIMVLLGRALLLYFFSFYDLPRPTPRSELLRKLFVFIALEALLLAGFFFLSDRTFPRSVVLLFVMLDLGLLAPWRMILQRAYRPVERKVVLVGCNQASRELAEQIEIHHWHGLSLAGFVATPDEDVDPKSLPGPLLGCVDELATLERQGLFDDIILADETPAWKTRLIDRLAESQASPINVRVLPGAFESLIGSMRYRWVRDIPLIDVVNRSEWELNRPLKRALDLIIGGLLLITTLPLLAICAVLITTTSRGPIFYRQIRIGRHRTPFTLYKLRTMRLGAENPKQELLATLDDPRLTAIGAALRRFRLDELPQLWNVIGGTMSLVGPRPERPGFVEQYLKDIPGYAERFVLRPGLTGLAQVNGDYHSSPQNKLRYDLAYRANWNLWLDLSILFRTVRIVFSFTGT